MIACHWSDYEGSGSGDNTGSSAEATEVDGEEVSWSDAVDGMNSAIDTWNSENADKQCEWKYELLAGNELPTLTSE